MTTLRSALSRMGGGKQNLAATEVSLSEDDVQEIAGLERSRRYLLGDFFAFEGSPYTLENLWDEPVTSLQVRMTSE